MNQKINTNKYKRILRKLFAKKEGKRISVSFSTATKVFLFVAILAFLSTQLITNAILSPLGHELQALNSEKNLLVEDNRVLEQEIAIDTSLTIIKVYSENQFEISADAEHDSIYVTDTTVQAQR